MADQRAISDFYTEEQFRGTELYRRFYGPLGVDGQIAFRLPSPALVVAVTLHREWRDFPSRDRLLLNLLRPQLIQALRNAHAYERLYRLLAAILRRLGLTPRQSEVLDPAARGAANAEIAVALRISVSTVEAHMTQAPAKLGVQSRAAAASLLHQALTERSPEADR